MAQVLAGKTPYECALISHQAQEIWDKMRQEKLGHERARQAHAHQMDADETFVDMTAAWVGAVVQR